MLEAKIIDRGRGPEIAGTRITVYDVVDYHKTGWHRDMIADTLELSSQQVEVAIRYIEGKKGQAPGPLPFSAAVAQAERAGSQSLFSSLVGRDPSPFCAAMPPARHEEQGPDSSAMIRSVFFEPA